MRDVAQDQGASAYDTIVPDSQIVGDGGVHSHKTALTNIAKSRDNDMGRDEAMILDRGMVTDMITAP